MQTSTEDLPISRWRVEDQMARMLDEVSWPLPIISHKSEQYLITLSISCAAIKPFLLPSTQGANLKKRQAAKEKGKDRPRKVRTALLAELVLLVCEGGALQSPVMLMSQRLLGM